MPLQVNWTNIQLRAWQRTRPGKERLGLQLDPTTSSNLIQMCPLSPRNFTTWRKGYHPGGMELERKMAWTTRTSMSLTCRLAITTQGLLNGHLLSNPGLVKMVFIGEKKLLLNVPKSTKEMSTMPQRLPRPSVVPGRRHS